MSNGDIPENLEDLVNLRISREQWLASAHFCKDATDRPHIDARGVLTTA